MVGKRYLAGATLGALINIASPFIYTVNSPRTLKEVEELDVRIERLKQFGEGSTTEYYHALAVRDSIFELPEYKIGLKNYNLELHEADRKALFQCIAGSLLSLSSIVLFLRDNIKD